MAPSPDVLYGLRVADSVALIAMLLGAPLLKGPAPQPSSDGHSEITSVVHAVKNPRRRLIVSLLSLAAVTAFLEALVTVANALFRHVLETKLPSWRGIELYSVALFVAFGALVVVGLLKETRGAPIWQSTLLKAFVLTGLVFDLVIVVFLILAADWNDEPQDPEAKRLGFAPLAHFVLVVLRVLVLIVLFPVLFTCRTSYELVDQNGAGPQTSEASRLIASATDDAETSAGLAAPKYGTFDHAPPVDDAHAPPPVDDTHVPIDTKKRDTGEAPGYSVDTPVGSTRDAHALPIPAVDTPDNLSIVPTEAGAVSLGLGPQIVPTEQLAGATVQSEHPVPIKPEHQEPTEQSSPEVKPDVSFAAVAASAPKVEDAPKLADAPVLVDEPQSEEPSPVAFPQSESTPAPLAFPKSDDETPAAESARPALQETTSSPGISFALGTEGERIKHAAQRVRKMSVGAAAKTQQGLNRLARRMSVGPGRHGGESSAKAETPASEDAPKSTEEPKADDSAAPVSFPQSEAAAGASAPLAFPKGEDTASVTGSARPALREIASTDSATPSVTFAPNTDGERVKQAAQRIRKISQGAAAKSQQSLARLARRMSVGPSRQSSISSSIASPPGTPGFLQRTASGSVRQSMDDGAEASGAEDKKKKDKKDKKDKRKSTAAD